MVLGYISGISEYAKQKHRIRGRLERMWTTVYTRNHQAACLSILFSLFEWCYDVFRYAKYKQNWRKARKKVVCFLNLESPSCLFIFYVFEWYYDAFQYAKHKHRIRGRLERMWTTFDTQSRAGGPKKTNVLF